MPQTQVFCQHMSPEGCYIKYRLNLKKIKLETIAQKVQRSVALVSQVIYRNRTSKKVEAALAKALGYASWEQLWTVARANVEREAV